MRNAIHFLGGSVAVYVLMAACSAGGSGKRGGGDQAASNGGDTHGGAAASQGAATASGGVDGMGAMAMAGTAEPSGMGGIIGEMMDPVPDAEAETSGTRLKARYYVGEDGSRQFIGWRDTMRDEDCAFYKSTDGVIRCTPFYYTAPPATFTDAGCTQPATIVVKATGSACGVASPAGKYVYHSTDSCGTSRQRYAVSGQPSAQVFVKSGDNCIDVTASYQATYDTFALTTPEAAPNSAFVAATEQVE